MTTNLSEPLCYTQAQACKLLHYGPDTVARLIREGKLYARIDHGLTGKKIIRIPHAALVAFLDGREYSR